MERCLSICSFFLDEKRTKKSRKSKASTLHTHPNPRWIFVPALFKFLIFKCLQKLLGKKEKKAAACACKICKTLMEEGEGHVLVSAQVISSQKYWDNVMIEPAAKSYTIAHFEQQDASATQMRTMIFLRSASFENPWALCDTCIKMFEVDYNATQANAQEWWKTNKSFRPSDCGKAEDNLEKEKYEDYQNYAVMEAGKAVL